MGAGKDFEYKIHLSVSADDFTPDIEKIFKNAQKQADNNQVKITLTGDDKDLVRQLSDLKSKLPHIDLKDNIKVGLSDALKADTDKAQQYTDIFLTNIINKVNETLSTISHLEDEISRTQAELNKKIKIRDTDLGAGDAGKALDNLAKKFQNIKVDEKNIDKFKNTFQQIQDIASSTGKEIPEMVNKTKATITQAFSKDIFSGIKPSKTYQQYMEEITSDVLGLENKLNDLNGQLKSAQSPELQVKGKLSDDFIVDLQSQLDKLQGLEVKVTPKVDKDAKIELKADVKTDIENHTGNINPTVKNIGEQITEKKESAREISHELEDVQQKLDNIQPQKTQEEVRAEFEKTRSEVAQTVSAQEGYFESLYEKAKTTKLSYEEVIAVVNESEKISSQFAQHKLEIQDTDFSGYDGKWENYGIEFDGLKANSEDFKQSLTETYKLYKNVESAIKNNAGMYKGIKYDPSDLEELKGVFQILSSYADSLGVDINSVINSIPRMTKEFKELATSSVEQSRAVEENNRQYDGESEELRNINEKLQQRYNLLEKIVTLSVQGNISKVINVEDTLGGGVLSDFEDKDFKYGDVQTVVEHICKLLEIDIPSSVNKAKEALTEVNTTASTPPDISGQDREQAELNETAEAAYKAGEALKKYHEIMAQEPILENGNINEKAFNQQQAFYNYLSHLDSSKIDSNELLSIWEEQRSSFTTPIDSSEWEAKNNITNLLKKTLEDLGYVFDGTEQKWNKLNQTISQPVDTSAMDKIEEELREETNEASRTEQAFSSLEEKLEYLKSIKSESKFLETAKDKRIDMEDKAWDVGGNRPKSEADSQNKIRQYEELCTHIDTANEALDAFNDKYEKVIVTKKSGEKIEIFDAYDLDTLNLAKKSIQDIVFVLTEEAAAANGAAEAERNAGVAREQGYKYSSTDNPYKALKKGGLGLQYFNGDEANILGDDIVDKYQQNVITITETNEKFSADTEVTCEKAETAIRKFFNTIGSQIPELAGWKDQIVEAIQNGTFSMHDDFGLWNWGIEEIEGDEKAWYVYINNTKKAAEETVQLRNELGKLGALKNSYFSDKGFGSFKEGIFSEDQEKYLAKEQELITRVKSGTMNYYDARDELSNMLTQMSHSKYGVDRFVNDIKDITVPTELTSFKDGLISQIKNGSLEAIDAVQLLKDEIAKLQNVNQTESTSTTLHNQSLNEQLDFYREFKKVVQEYWDLQGKASDPEYSFSEAESRRLDKITPKYEELIKIINQYSVAKAKLKNGETYDFINGDPSDWTAKINQIKSFVFELRDLNKEQYIKNSVGTTREVDDWIYDNVNSQMYPPVVDYVSTEEEIQRAINKITEYKDKLAEIAGSNYFGELSSNMQSDIQNTIKYLDNLITTENKQIEMKRRMTEEMSGQQSVALYEESSGQMSMFEQEAEAKRDSAKASDELREAEEKRKASSSSTTEHTEQLKQEEQQAKATSDAEKELAQAKNQINNSNNDTIVSSEKISEGFKNEADSAEKATEQIEKAEGALERYIRKQTGKVGEESYGFVQALNKVVDEKVVKTKQDDGTYSTTKTLMVNYDKLSKEILNTDTEIYNLEQKIKATTQGDTTGWKNNLQTLKDTRKEYEKLLSLMVKEPIYEVDSSQVKILTEQRANNQTYLQNIQDTKDSIAQLKANAQSVSLGFDVEIKNNELVDFVDRLKELNIYSPKAQKTATDLANALSQVTTKSGLSDISKQFTIFKQDMATDIEGALQDEANKQSNINSTIKEQVTAYKNVWNIRKQLAKLDTSKDANQIAELKAQEQEQKNIYITKTQELRALDQQIAKEQVLNNAATIRKKTEDEIRTIKAKQTDTEVNNDITSRYDSIISKYKEIESLHRKIQSLTMAGVSSKDSTITDRQAEIDKLQQEINATDKLGFSTEQLAAVKKAETSATQAQADAKAKLTAKGQTEQQQIEKTRASLQKQISTLMNNGKLMEVYREQIMGFYSEVQGSNIDMSRLNQIRIEIDKITAAANAAGQSGKTLGQILQSRFKSLVAYLSTFASFYRVVSYVRSAFSTLKDLDTQLVDLRKTTTMTTSELNDFYKASSDVAKQMGVTTSEIISQASAWSRLNKIGLLYGNI